MTYVCGSDRDIRPLGTRPWADPFGTDIPVRTANMSDIFIINELDGHLSLTAHVEIMWDKFSITCGEIG
jgi:hypothetical protein